MYSRRNFLKLTAASIAAMHTPDLNAMGQKPKRPNVIMFFVDDLGWADIKYQKQRYNIPNIDRLTADGMTFTDAYSASPTCSPSRASVITGLHPARLRLVRHISGTFNENEFSQWKGDPANFPSRNWLPLENPTYAKQLKLLGYRTAFVGKWHLGHEPFHPIHHGFDEQYGVTNHGNPKSYYPPFFPNECQTYKDVPKDKYLTDKLTDDAVAYISKQQSDQPFQLTLFYYSAHTPYKGRADLLEKAIARGLTGSAAHHAAMIDAVDESIGRIRKTLQEKHIDDNTIIFFAGDQGGHFANDPLRGSKKGGLALYEGGARVPFIVHWPKVTTPGSTSSVPVLTTDISPTMIQMAGNNTPTSHPSDGISLLPLLKQTGNIDRTEIYMYRSYEDQYAAVRSGNFKLIAYRSGRAELYDLADDLGETNDLANSNPQKVTQLKEKLHIWEKKMGL
ncbi:MAG: sulfatase [Anaerohalosphaera sp.]|nr:sulfatase [Anaerohalosphaera sp.]